LAALVVFPQLHDQHWWNTEDAAFALKALDATQQEFATDVDRVYLTGIPYL
jgi:hypothetical protein